MSDSPNNMASVDCPKCPSREATWEPVLDEMGHIQMNLFECVICHTVFTV